MPDDEQNPGAEPEINAVAVNLADLVDGDELEDGEPLDEAEEEELEEEAEDEEDAEGEDGDEEDEEPEEPEEEEQESKGGLDSIMDDIFADEAEEDDRLKAFGDLEHLTMVEVSAEVEAVLEELRIRQGGDE